MEVILNFIKNLAYIYEEVFWLKECLTIMESLFVFSVVWLVMKLDYRKELLLYIGTFIGVVCIFLGDTGYFSDNDVLKFIAPTSLFLIAYYNKQDKDSALFMFLIPYFITSYEFYRSFFAALESIVTHTLIIFSIIFVKENRYLFLLISIIIGIFINSIGYSSPPGTNDILVNPALITLATKGLEFYTKNNKYTDFLKTFWTTLLCFAFLGSWIFHYTKPLFSRYSH